MSKLLIPGLFLTTSLTVLPEALAQTPRDEMVTFKNGAVTIACTLTVPASGGPFPAVVLLSGSGPQNRDSDLLGFLPFKLLAEHFSSRGIAVLRCDDRGVGGSSGSLPDSTTEDFAHDALAAVRLLQARVEIQKTRIGLIGHSEGAIAAAIAAAASADVRFIVWMAGSAVPGEEVMQQQAAKLTRAAGASESVVADVVREHAALLDSIKRDVPAEELKAVGRRVLAAQSAAMPEAQRKALADPGAREQLLNHTLSMLQSRWMRFFIGFDPADTLRRVSCPVLALFGGRDLQVLEATNRVRLEAALKEGGNQQVTMKVYPEANHLFMSAVTGQPAEYATLEKAFVPSLMDDIATWVLSSSRAATPAVKVGPAFASQR
jgi:pimeloyl-ACP methyl ester carboxylesterase